MSNIAFIYPGQGAQKAGMGKDFYENSPLSKQIFDDASKLLGMDMKALCFEPNDKLDITEYTQAAMVTTCLAMTAVVKERGIYPNVTAGLSLGEYCAIAETGAMSVMDAIKTVRKRGILMQEAVPKGEGTMAAILGLDAETIEQVIEPISGVSVANYNCPGQIVITGKVAAVEEACEKLSEAGAKRTVRLNVSGPFHSKMLETAGCELAAELSAVPLEKPMIPYVTNVTGEHVIDETEIKALLAAQVASPVRWQQCVESMLKAGVDTFIEIGPGKTLAGFMRKISKGTKVINIEKWEDLEKLEELKAH